MKIEFSFDDRFKELYRRIEEKYGSEMMALEGVDMRSMDIAYLEDKFDASDVAADYSSDGNANVDDRSILAFENEYPKSIQKLNSLHTVWKYMVSDPNLGIKRANKCIEALINGDLKLHDSHSVRKSYCYAFDLGPLTYDGLPFIKKIKIDPPKRFKSFINLVIQMTSYVSNQIMGAVAYPNFFVYADWYARIQYGENYLDNPEYAKSVKEDLQSLVYSFNFPFRSGSQSAFVNLNVYDKYFMKDMFENMYYKDGSKPNLESIDKLQRFYLQWFVDESKRQTLTFPVNTATMYRNTDNEIPDKDFLNYVSELNCTNGTFNIFTGKLGVLSSCCRLLNDTTDEQYQNSFGAAGVSIGSVRVVTLNLPAIAYQTTNDEEFMKRLEYSTKMAQDILLTVRNIVGDTIDAGRLPLYDHGFMNLNKQFMTLGHIGMYEALEITGKNILEESGEHFAHKILEQLNILNKEKTKSDKLIRNVEGIPGEGAAVSLCKKMQLRFKENKKYRIFANQYIPLTTDVDVHDRLRIQGAMDDQNSGGAICHLNMIEPLTPNQMKVLITAAAKMGVIYFAINMLFCRCTTCGKLHIGKMDKSPCHNAPVEKFMRVVGFLTKVSDWVPDRRLEFENRQMYTTDCL
jgi:ribonucleoside-triphosphate reductase